MKFQGPKVHKSKGPRLPMSKGPKLQSLSLTLKQLLLVLFKSKSLDLEIDSIVTITTHHQHLTIPLKYPETNYFVTIPQNELDTGDPHSCYLLYFIIVIFSTTFENADTNFVRNIF